ncbi:MAG: T9SS type A sorting domain-containing protein [Bacteroidetes bacterium]|nr:T9SS type A sorting domain-containing protein [Bacteroidota bacterium]
MLGETVLTQQINFDKSQTLNIETGPGIYFLEISNNNQRCIQQLIIK